MQTMTRRNSFLQRLIGAAALDVAIYEEVEADSSATTQAFLVVLMVSFAAGLGAWGVGERTLANLAWVSCLALVSWAAWALLIFEVGARLLPEPDTRVDVGQLLRTLGFSATPGLLLALGIMPPAAIPVFAVTTVWMLVAMIVAVRHALDYARIYKAIAVCVLAWVLVALVTAIIGFVFAPSVS
jgi:hypothetical protein